MILLIWSLAILVSLYLYFKKVYSHFKEHGVNYRKPFAPFGNLLTSTIRREHLARIIQKTYNAFPDDRFVGHYEFVNYLVLVKDLELIKKITIKDFDYFTDHRAFINEDNDPLFGRNLFSLRGQDWRDMRPTLSPAFTSSKIRLMVPFMTEIGDQMNKVLAKKIKESGGVMDIDIKDLTTRYANDVIASCAFGLKTDSHTVEDNEFYLKGKEASTFSFWQTLKLFFYMSFPRLMTLLNLKLFSDDTKKFFTELVQSVIHDREKKHILRPDLIQLLMDAKKGTISHDTSSASEDAGFATVEESEVGQKKINREWSDMDLIAQAVLFFIAGFDTVATSMSFLLMELALNPDVQDKLVQEIKETDKKTGGKLDYRAIQEMQYMDMVVSETLRLWPPAIATDRLCVKNYNMGRPNSAATEDYILRKGQGVWIPVFPIHRSPEYYPDPDKFDPERFSAENKYNIKPFTYLPFGMGPRNCIGSRFALCEVKVMVYQLLKDMVVSPSKKTRLPLELAPESFNPRVKGGHWLKISIRK